MKYPASTYARALARAIIDAKTANNKEKDEIVRRFIALIRKNGDEVHIRKIAEEAARFVRGARGIRKVTLETARPLAAAQKKMLSAFVKDGDIIEEAVNPELIAGIKIILNDELQFDGSLKGKLDKLLIA